MVKPGIEKRLSDSIENVLELSKGLMTVDVIDGEPIQFSESFSARTVESVSGRSNREVFLSTIRLAPVRPALDWDTRWSLMWI